MSTTTARAARYRQSLPQLDTALPFLTDGGLETTLVFHEGWDLPCFAAFVLMETPEGIEVLKSYFRRYIALAQKHGIGFVLDSPTWRANPDWGARIGFDTRGLADVNRRSIELLHALRDEYEAPGRPMIVSGAIGPRGDGYDPGRLMTAEEAEGYHRWQIELFRDAGADLVTAYTMTNVNEAIGVATAAARSAMPSVISFTVETDGRLPTGDSLEAAIVAVDRATSAAPAYYMINCAHPDHFADALAEDAAWTRRIRGLRANASRRSHAELDNSTDLDIGDPAELGDLYAALRRRFPQLMVLGGCCGTDDRHVGCIGAACLA